jgi:hypothetical protein
MCEPCNYGCRYQCDFKKHEATKKHRDNTRLRSDSMLVSNGNHDVVDLVDSDSIKFSNVVSSSSSSSSSNHLSLHTTNAASHANLTHSTMHNGGNNNNIIIDTVDASDASHPSVEIAILALSKLQYLAAQRHW